MKRLILLLFSAMACAQTFTVSGHVVNPNTGVPTGMTITFSLINTGTQQCKVSGTGLIVPNNQVFTPDNTGTISGTLYRNDFIICGGSSNTQWQYQILGPGVTMPKCALAAVTTTSLNVDSAACTNTVPVVTPPLGDTTYCRLDGSNCGFTGNVTFNSHNISAINNATITGALTAGSFNNVLHAGAGTTACTPGTDIGAQINNCYALLPATGGTIIVDPQASGAAYNFSTPIVFATSGKYIHLECSGASANTNTVSTPCLNYTPTTSTVAITIDVAPNPSTQGAVYGLYHVHLTNNGCLTSNGCGSSAVGIKCGTTNAGCVGATFDNVSVNGFNFAWQNTNSASSDIAWLNPQFVANSTVAFIGNNTGTQFFGGTFAADAAGIVTSAAGSAPAIQLFGTQFFSIGTAIDCTNTVGAPGLIDGYGIHFEAAVGTTSHFIKGVCDLNLHGGIMEDDNTTGSTDWFISSGGNNINIEAVIFSSAGRTISEIILMNSPTRAIVRGEFNHPNESAFAATCAGTNAANCTVEMANGPSTTATLPFLYESILQAPNGTASAPGFGFRSNTNSGMYNNSGDVCWSNAGNAQACAGAGRAGLIVGNNGCFSYTATSNPDAAPAGGMCSNAAKVFNFGTAVGNADTTGWVKTSQTLQVITTNYTTTGTTLAGAGVVTGLNFTAPVSLASNWSFTCNLIYSQATAAAANLFGITTAGTAPTNLQVWGAVYTSNAGVVVQNNALITTATSTTVVTATPSAAGAIGTNADMFQVNIHGTLEAPSNATPSQVGIAVATGSASDALTIYRGSSCWWY